MCALYRAAPHEISGLHNLSKEIPKRAIMVEIGSAFGESTEIFSHYFAKIYAIDPWARLPEAEVAFNQMKAKHPNIIKLKGIDPVFLNNFPAGCLDFIYIDAEHDYGSVKKQILDWWPKIRQNGVIGGHDYALPGVIKAVDEIFVKPDKVFEDTSWIVTLG